MKGIQAVVGPGRPNRREVLAGLGALALAACTDDQETAGPAAPRVAVIGGGMAGVATAWLIEQQVPVDLFEARSSLGGNVRTAQVEVAGQQVAVDLGAQYFNDRAYPTYRRLLERLGAVDTQGAGSFVAPSAITVMRQGEATPLFVSPVVPSRLWPVAEAWNREAISAFTAFAEGARRLDADDVDWSLTVEAWLPTLGISEAMREGLLLPWTAGINSGVIGTTRDFSARAATIFLGRALGPDGALESTTYATLTAGMGAVINQLATESTAMTPYLGQAVEGVERRSSGLWVVAGGQRRGPYTAVVLANPKGSSLLGNLTGMEATVAALAGIETFEATLALHRDPTYAPADTRYHSLLNAEVTEDFCEVSMSMAAAMAPLADGQPVDLWKSWIGHRSQMPADVITTEKYTHIHIGPGTLQAQARLAALQGAGGFFFAGGWTQPFDAQETALASAMAVARSLAPASERLAVLEG